MGVSVQFGTCKDAHNVISKTATLGTAKSAELKQPTSVESPYFIVDSSSVSNTDNYCQCSDFSRYYYIVSIDELPGHRKGVQCVCDVLKSFEASILALPVLVERNENTDQSYINDQSVTTYNKMITTYKGFSGNNLAKAADGDDRYVILMA